MPLAAGQWQVRDLVLGPGTVYQVEQTTNPFTLTVRADQGGPRAWNHGSWSGAEWANERVVPLRVMVEGASHATWLSAFQQLVAAFAPVGDSTSDVELRFEYAGAEYILLGRPRMVEPDTGLLASFTSLVRLAFVAQDPRIYSGVLHDTGAMPLPTQIGGLAVPFTVPFTIAGTVVGGGADLVNAGTADAGFTARIDGPIVDPLIIVRRPDGTVQSLAFSLTIGTGQWLAVDTAARTAFLNGLPEASVRGQVAWDMDSYPLQPGTNVFRFRASDIDIGTATITWRSAWW